MPVHQIEAGFTWCQWAQRWPFHTLSDEGTVAEVIDSRAFSEFCGVESSNQVPDGDTLGRFRNLLIRNGMQERLFTQVVEQLEAQGLLQKSGTIVDSTLISAPYGVCFGKPDPG